MLIDNVALLIPCHPPHYQFIYNLINKLNNNNIIIDIFIVFSNTHDHMLFEMKDAINFIIAPRFNTLYMITYKKFVGLKYLENSKYDYIICCDSEIDIIPNHFTSENINNKINQIFTNKKIYAGSISAEYQHKVTQSCAYVLKHHFETIRNKTDNFSLYYWWSDLPVYRRIDISPFLSMIDYSIINNFDYMIYQNYLLIYDGFEIIPTTHITNLYHSLEFLNTTDENIFQQLLNIGYGFSWNNNMIYTQNKEFVDNQNGFIVYHLDR